MLNAISKYETERPFLRYKMHLLLNGLFGGQNNKISITNRHPGIFPANFKTLKYHFGREFKIIEFFLSKLYTFHAKKTRCVIKKTIWKAEEQISGKNCRGSCFVDSKRWNKNFPDKHSIVYAETLDNSFSIGLEWNYNQNSRTGNGIWNFCKRGEVR